MKTQVDFPYDMEGIYGRMLKRFRQHTDLCRDEITMLRSELMRTQMALELAREEIQRLQDRPT